VTEFEDGPHYVLQPSGRNNLKKLNSKINGKNVGTQFEYGPQYVLQRSGVNAGSYKWAHVNKGKGRNIFGKVYSL
jgi:hypothetical protein